MLSLISKYYLYPSILNLVRFKDFGTKKDEKKFLKIFERWRMRHIILLIDEWYSKKPSPSSPLKMQNPSVLVFFIGSKIQNIKLNYNISLKMNKK